MRNEREQSLKAVRLDFDTHHEFFYSLRHKQLRLLRHYDKQDRTRRLKNLDSIPGYRKFFFFPSKLPASDWVPPIFCVPETLPRGCKAAGS